MEEKKPAKKKRTKPLWTDQQLALLNEILGKDFADFYNARYDENGNLKPDRPQIPGLKPPQQQEGQREEDSPFDR